MHLRKTTKPQPVPPNSDEGEPKVSALARAR